MILCQTKKKAMNRIQLRYGMNPHQKPASAFSEAGIMPFEVLNGSPGYINLMDAMNSWQLVKELEKATGRVSAASFKHVSPAGVAVSGEVDDGLRRMCFVEDLELSDTASAYVKARSVDRMSSFGDWAAVSCSVDVSMARVLKREVSDGIIAPGYDTEALKILAEKKNGKYCILEIDKDYQPPNEEIRQVYGINLCQRRNDAELNRDYLKNIVTTNDSIPESDITDLLIAAITAKYTQSNTICLAFRNQAVGIGAGQQSRIHCTKLAITKAQTWWLRQHPAVLALEFKRSSRRPDRDNALTQFVSDLLPKDKTTYDEVLLNDPEPLTQRERLI